MKLKTPGFVLYFVYFEYVDYGDFGDDDVDFDDDGVKHLFFLWWLGGDKTLSVDK